MLGRRPTSVTNWGLASLVTPHCSTPANCRADSCSGVISGTSERVETAWKGGFNRNTVWLASSLLRRGWLGSSCEGRANEPPGISMRFLGARIARPSRLDPSHPWRRMGLLARLRA